MGALSIALGNIALLWLYPSTVELISNTQPAWVLLSTLAMGDVTSYNVWSVTSVVLVVLGGILCGIGEVNLDLFGLFCALSSVGTR